MSEKSNGIILAKPTGNILDSDPQYIEVNLPDNQLVYARPCYLFGLCLAPSKSWLNKYKDEIFICIINQDGYRHKPMWVGYTPIDGKLTDVPKNFPASGYFRTEKFIFTFDDENKSASFIERDSSNTEKQSINFEDSNFLLSTEKIVLKSPNIKIGSDNTTEHLVLGDTLNTNLGTLYAQLNQLITAITTFNTAISAIPIISSAAAPALANYVQASVPIIQAVSNLSASLQKQISSKHTTE